MTIITLQARANRTGEGFTPSATIPADITNFACVRMDTDLNDKRNSALTAYVEMQISRDNGATWKVIAGFTWQGNNSLRYGVEVGEAGIYISNARDYIGALVRGHYIIPVSTRTGFILEYNI
jgi:hypothetical protein